MSKKTVLIGFMIILASGCSGMGKEENAFTTGEIQKAQARLISSDSKIDGKVVLEESKEGIVVTADIKGLRPNSVHGFHVHEKGRCDFPDFKSAGDHFNPEGTAHGGPGAPVKHAGDMGNVVADENGRAKKKILFGKDDVEELRMLLSKTVILHDKADDLYSQPSGEAGGRLACGIIIPVGT